MREAADRLARAGVVTAAQPNVTCCYAVQNKVWATDPDGNKWEVYVVLDNDAAERVSSSRGCCADDCCQDTGTAPQGGQVAGTAACCSPQAVAP